MEIETQELTIRRSFKAPRDRVFRAWTDPASVQQWFMPRPGGRVDVADIDLKVGGSYRIVFIDSDGTEYAVGGVYTEVAPPARLAYTWQWEQSGMQPGETTVIVEFVDRGAQTELILTHQRLASPQSKEAHGYGWSGCLEGFAKHVEAG